MPIDPQRWTEKTRAAFEGAARMATEAQNPEITPAHLLSAVLADPESIARPVLAKVGVAPDDVVARLAEARGRLPRAVGGQEPTLGRAAREGLEAADRLRGDLGDDYLSVEHLLLAFADDLGTDRDRLLQALREVRGSHRVTSANPEDTFQALERYGRDLTE